MTNIEQSESLEGHQGSKPVISVVMPTFNDAEFILSSIDAILNQDFKDFELIIINDGCTDNTDEIVKKYLKNDHRIKYFLNEKNRGVVESVNRGIALAKGKYFYGASSDDIIGKKFFSKMINELITHPEIPIAVCDSYWFMNEIENGVFTKKLLPQKTICTDRVEILNLYKKKRFYVSSYTSLVDINYVRKYGMFEKKFGYACDHVLYNTIAINHGFLYLPGFYTYLRVLSKEERRDYTRSYFKSLQDHHKFLCDLKKNKIAWEAFYKSSSIAASLRTKEYCLLFHPKHWHILLPLCKQKFMLIFNKPFDDARVKE